MLGALPLNIKRAGIIRARFLALLVVVILSVAIIAVGFSALGQTRDSEAYIVYGESTQADDNSAVSAFKFVCPFH